MRRVHGGLHTAAPELPWHGLTADAGWARPHRSSQAYLCPAALLSALFHLSANKNSPQTRRWCWQMCLFRISVANRLHAFLHQKPPQTSPQPGQREWKGTSRLLAALLFQVGVGFRKIRHFYFVINSVSSPANSDVHRVKGGFLFWNPHLYSITTF